MEFALEQNYPNPFNPATKIEFDISENSFTSLKVFDVSGKQVADLVNENLQAGAYKVNFSAGDLSSGIYFYTLKTDKFSATKRMILVK